MNRFGVRFAVLAALMAGLAFMSSGTSAQDKKEVKKEVTKEKDKEKTKEEVKALTIKECMSAQNKTRKAIEVAVKGEKWDDAAAGAKVLVKVCGDLTKSTPKKGDADSWKTQTGKYAETVKAISGSIEKKDAEGANKALKTLGASCMDCHAAHK
mgnify:CR=1 FL=1